jgi:hypothetical protein
MYDITMYTISAKSMCKSVTSLTCCVVNAEQQISSKGSWLQLILPLLYYYSLGLQILTFYYDEEPPKISLTPKEPYVCFAPFVKLFSHNTMVASLALGLRGVGKEQDATVTDCGEQQSTWQPSLDWHRGSKVFPSRGDPWRRRAMTQNLLVAYQLSRGNARGCSRRLTARPIWKT